VGHVAQMGTMRNECKILVDVPEGVILTGKFGHRREGNIKLQAL